MVHDEDLVPLKEREDFARFLELVKKKPGGE